MKVRKNRLICGVVLILFLPNIASAMQLYTIYGDIVNMSGNNGNGANEPGVDATILYNDSAGNPVQMTTASDQNGRYSFTISDYRLSDSYRITASKGSYVSPTVAGRIFPSEEGGSQYIGAVTISENAVIVRIVPNSPIINKGDPLLVNITVEPAGNVISGMQVFPSFTQSRIMVSDTSEGNLFNRNSGSYFLNLTTLSGEHAIAGLAFGTSTSSNGTFATLNTSGLNNGTANFTVNGLMFSSPKSSWTRAALYPLINEKITTPADVDGNFVEGNIIDISIVNKFLGQTAPNLCPQYYGRCDVDKDGNVDSDDLNLTKAGKGRRVNTTV